MIASMAVSEELDADLVKIDASHMFEYKVEKAMMLINNDEVERMFKGHTLPVK